MESSDTTSRGMKVNKFQQRRAGFQDMINLNGEKSITMMYPFT
jgi:hypothetical protein